GQGGALGEQAHRALGGMVGRRGAEAADDAEHGADVDHRAVAVGLEGGGGGLVAEEDRGLGDGDDPLVGGQVGILDQAGVADAGVVHQHVQTTELGHRLGHYLLPVFFAGHIQVLVYRHATARGDGLG